MTGILTPALKLRQGIGHALAEKFIENGSYVIASGRRKENLEQLVHKHCHDKISAVLFDITNLDGVPNFAATITTTHSDLDCVFLNSGIQRGFNFAKPETIDIEMINEEFVTNYLSYLALTKAFLPFLQAKDTESSLIYTTSALALVPIARCPNYCASKAALHHFILCLRRQLQGSKIKVIEIFPPAVQTELQDEKHQPDIKGGRLIGMPLAEFTDAAYEGLVEGRDQIPVGMAKSIFDAFETKRQEIFNRF
jgi:short-subunit dehydrogenase involved in D-alanine esterification of teichoic acids